MISLSAQRTPEWLRSAGAAVAAAACPAASSAAAAAPMEAGAAALSLPGAVPPSPVLPGALVDYAAARALPRATTWLRPVMEDMAQGLPPICKQPGVFASEDASAQRRPVR